MVVGRVTELIIREKTLLCDHTVLFIRYKVERSGDTKNWPLLRYAWYYVTRTYEDTKHWPTEMLSIAKHLKNLWSSSKHDRPHTKRNIYTARTDHLHARNFYDKYNSMRGFPSVLIFQNKRSRGTRNAKLKITINRLSIERTDEDEPRLHSAAARTPSTKSKPSYTSVECTLPSTNKHKP